MRFLVVGDIHAEVGNIIGPMRSIKAEGLEVDAVLQLGDFSGVTKLHFERTISGCHKIAQEYGTPVYFIDGNHEDFPSLSAYQSDEEVIFWDRGTRWVVGGKRFGALGGAFSVDWARRTLGLDWHPEDELVKPEQVMGLGAEPLDVLVTHDVGYRAHDSSMNGFEVGPMNTLRSAQNQYLVQLAIDTTRPQWAFHGHWHCLNLKTDDRSGTRTVGLGHTPHHNNHVIYDTQTNMVTSEDPELQRKLDALNEWQPRG